MIIASSLMLLASCAKNTLQQENLPTTNLVPGPNNPKEEERVMKLVEDLPTVKEHAVYMEKQTQGKRHQLVWIFASPKENEGKYWIKVGEDNGMAYVTAYNFYVDPKTNKVGYYDTAQDTLVDSKDLERYLKNK